MFKSGTESGFRFLVQEESGIVAEVGSGSGVTSGSTTHLTTSNKINSP